MSRGVALQQLFGVTMLRLPGPALYRGGGPIIFLVRAVPTMLHCFLRRSHSCGRSQHCNDLVVRCRATTDHGQTSTWTLLQPMGMLRC